MYIISLINLFIYQNSVIGILFSSIMSVCFSTESLSQRFQFLEAPRKRSHISTLDYNWNSLKNVRSFEFLHRRQFNSSA